MKIKRLIFITSIFNRFNKSILFFQRFLLCLRCIIYPDRWLELIHRSMFFPIYDKMDGQKKYCLLFPRRNVSFDGGDSRSLTFHICQLFISSILSLNLISTLRIKPYPISFDYLYWLLSFFFFFLFFLFF